MRSRIPAVVFACVATCIAIMGAHHAGLTQNDSGSQTVDLSELLRQRRDVLAERHAWVLAAVQTSEATQVDAIRSHNALLEAELELATSFEERIVILRKHVENVKTLFERASAQFESGIISNADLLSAKAEYLAAEIRLARAEQGDN